MRVMTRTITVNAAFLQEIKADNRELRRLLREAGEMLSPQRRRQLSAKRLFELLGALRDQLAMHFSLEEAYGYFEDAVDVAPRLSQRAEALRSEHETLFTDVCDLVEHVEQLLYRETPPHAHQKIALRFVAFRRQLNDHEAGENELILQSLNDDLGVGD